MKQFNCRKGTKVSEKVTKRVSKINELTTEIRKKMKTEGSKRLMYNRELQMVSD